MATLEDKITVLEHNSYFQFSQISEYVMKYSAEEFIKIFLDDSVLKIDENLDKLVFQGTTPVIVGENLPSFSIYWHDLWEIKELTWKVLKNFIYPVYRDKDDGEIFAHDYNENLWRTRFIEDYQNLKTYSISNRTNFNEKFGWYPHIKVDENYVPLSHIGEILVEGQKAYLFLDLDYSSEFFENRSDNRLDLSELGFSFDDLYAVILENDLKLDNKFVKHPLSEFDKKAISSENVDTDADVLNKRFIPYDPIFEFAPLVQDYYGPDFSDLINKKWKFIYQMPIPWHGSVKIEDTDFYYIDEGDFGSIAIFTNPEGKFLITYSQT